MTAVLAQMGGYPVCARGFADADGFDGIGLAASTSLTDGRNMVNIDVKALLLNRHQQRPIWQATFSEKNRVANWKTALLLVFLAGCASAPANTGSTTSNNTSYNGGLTGALAPRLAVEQFLNAAHTGDIQAMSVVFGTDKGAARDNIDRTELEKREIILQCFFNADKYRILSETVGKDGHRVIKAELTKGNMVRQPNFFVIQGPAGRWYVDNMEIAVVKEFCGQQSAGTT